MTIYRIKKHDVWNSKYIECGFTTTIRKAMELAEICTNSLSVYRVFSDEIEDIKNALFEDGQVEYLTLSGQFDRVIIESIEMNVLSVVV